MLSDSLIEPVCLHSLLFLLCFFASSPRLPTLLAACREKTSQRATTPPNDRTDISIYLSIYLCCRFLCVFDVSFTTAKTFLEPDSNFNPTCSETGDSLKDVDMDHLLMKTVSVSSIRLLLCLSASVAIPLCCRFCTLSISVLLLLYKTFLDPDSNSYLKRHSNAYAQQGHLLTKTTSLSSIRWCGSLTLWPSLYAGFVRFRCQFYYRFYLKLFSLRSLYVVGFARFRYQFYYGFYIKLFSTQIRIPT